MANLATINNNILADSGIDPLSLIVGTGTVNYVPKFTAEDTLAISQIFDNGTNVGIGTTSPSTYGKLAVVGSGLTEGYTVNTSTTSQAAWFSQNNSGTKTGVLQYGSAQAAYGALGGGEGALYSNGIMTLMTDGSGYLKFATGGNTERMRLTAAGNLGIGTSAPGGRLDVVPSAQNGINVARAGGYPSLYSSNDFVFETDGVFYFGVYTPRVFSVNSNFYVTTAGNVGIGTGTPTSKLELYNSSGDTRMTVTSTGGTGASDLLLKNASGTVAYEWYVQALGADGRFRIFDNTGGSTGERFTIDQSGNVGIGTSSPSYKLDINGQTRFQDIVYFANGNWNKSGDGFNRLYFANAGRTYFGSGGGYEWRSDGDGALMVLTNAGNLGIGTTSPNHQLAVFAGGGRTATTAINAGNSNVIPAIAIQSGETTWASATNGFAYYYNSTNGNLDLYRKDGAVTTEYQVMTWVRANGNVGIGTSSPTQKLVVIGNTAISGVTYTDYIQTYSGASIDFRHQDASVIMRIDTANAKVGIGTTSPGSKLEVYGGNISLRLPTYLGTARYGFGNPARTDDAAYIEYSGVGNFTGSLIFATNGTTSNIAATERMRITPTGNLGIGTASPQAKLQVSSATSDGIIVSTTANVEPFIAFWRNSASNGVGVLRLIDGGSLYFDNGATGASQATKMQIAPTGAVRFNAYGSGSFTGTRAYDLSVDASGNIIEVPVGAGTITGSGTTNYIPKFTSSSAIGNSQIFDNGTNVGIGTSAPAYKLDVVSTGDGASFSTNAASVATRIRNTGNNDVILRIANNNSNFYDIQNNYSDNSFTIDYNDAERLRISSTGNVSIGNTNNTYKLDVSGTGRFTDNLLVSKNQDAATSLTITNSTSGTSSESSLVLISNSSASFAIGKWSSGVPTYKILTASCGYLYNAVAGDITILNDYASGAIKMSAGGSSTAQLTLDASGNLGLGVSPSAWLSTYKAIQFGIGGALIGRSDDAGIELSSNAYRNYVGAYNYLNTSPSTSYRQYLGQHQWYTAPSGTAGNAISFTQAMTLDASGRLGIGTTSPTGKLQSNNASAYNSATPTGAIVASNLSNGNASIDIGVDATYLGYIQSRNITNTTYYNLLLNPLGGNVGIGTVNPQIGVDIRNGNLGVYLNTASSGGAQLYLGDTNFAGGAYATSAPGIGAVYGPTHLVAGDLAFYVYNGVASSRSEAMRIIRHSSGNNYVGIGTSSPGYTLQVKNSDASVTVSSSDSTAEMRINAQSGLAILETITNTDLRIRTNSTERMRITSGGNVGIGTSSPNAYGGYTTLTINNNSNGSILDLDLNDVRSATFSVTSTAAYIGSEANLPTIFIANGSERMRISSNGAIRFNTYGSGSFTGTVAYNLAVDSSGNIIETAGGVVDGSGTANYVPLWSDPNTLTNSTIYQTGGGNVGIGTTSPTQKLHIAGDVQIGESSGGEKLRFVGASNKYNFQLGKQINGDNIFEITPSTAAGGTTFSTPAFAVTYDSKIGIGTTSPSQKLEVAGIVRGEAVNVYGSSNPASTSPYLYSPSTGALGIGANGSERMRITSGGNVGIGTTSSFTIGGTAKVSVYGDAPFTFGLTNTDAIYLRRYGTGQYQFQTTANGGNTGDLSLQSYGGNVGIGTTSPGNKLTVNGDIAILAGNGIYFNNSVNTANSSIVCPGGGSMSIRSYGVEMIGLSENANLIFSTSSSEKMRITSTGNVGIGITAPVSKLEVSSTLNSSAFTGITVSNWAGGGAEQSRAGIAFKAYDWVQSAIWHGRNTTGGTDGALVLGTNPDTSNLTVGGVVGRMWIVNNGNVGINQGNPTYKLEVNGNLGSKVGAGEAQVFITNSTSQIYLFNSYAGNTFGIFDGTAGQHRILYDRGNNFLALYTGASERMRITSGGNVGIGTSNPINTGTTIQTTGAAFSTTATKNSNMYGLTLVSTTNENTMSGVWFGSGGGSHWSGIAGSRSNYTVDWSTHLSFYTHIGNTVNINDATEKMRITGDGNVWIGNDSNPMLEIANGGSTDALSGIRWVIGGARDNYGGIYSATSSAYNNYISFYTRNSISTVAERMRITSGGNVLVGTTSDGGYKLDVTGTLRVNGSNNTAVALTVNGADGSEGLVAKFARGNSEKNFYISATNNQYVNLATEGDFKFKTGITVNQPYTSGVDSMVITSVGRVGIGTTSPSGKLDVFSSSDVYTNISTSGNNTSAVLSLYNSSGVTDGAAICYNVAMRFGTVIGLNGSGFSEKMRLTSDGELLIGTTSDSGNYKLQVNGNGRFVGDVFATVDLRLTRTGTSPAIVLSQSQVRWVDESTGYSTSMDVISGGLQFGGSIKTASPSGGTAVPWKLGSRITNSCGLPATYADFASQFMVSNKVIEVEIDGVLVYIPIVNPGWC